MYDDVPVFGGRCHLKPSEVKHLLLFWDDVRSRKLLQGSD